MKTWLKGGLIGLASLLILIFIFPMIISWILCPASMGQMPIPRPSCYNFVDSIGNFIRISWNLFDFLSWIPCKGFCEGEEGMVKLITTIPSFFLLGALIGFIVGKIRNR